MPVPASDIVCRFINPDRETWNPRLNTPTQRAFKPRRQEGLSVWHRKRLCERGIPLGNLLIENLVGYGQAHHTVGDYLALALQVAQDENEHFQVRVEWCPEDEYVRLPWRQWRYAHAEVEAIVGPADFLREFRRKLAANARCIVPPA